MSKQILIDYDEYLELEKFKKLVDDIKEEIQYRATYIHNETEKSTTLKLQIPDSFKNLLGEFNVSYLFELSEIKFKM